MFSVNFEPGSDKSRRRDRPVRHALCVISVVLTCFLLASSALPQGTDAQAESKDSKPQQESLGDLARKNRPKDAQISKKRVWTSDDFEPRDDKDSPTSASGATTQENDQDIVRKFRLLDKQEIGLAVLKEANAPDVNFSDRRDWEQRLFEAKQAWVDQVARLDAHKDSNKDVRDEELRLAMGAQKNFYRVADEGIEKARAVNDPILKAHLEYQRRLDSCKVMSGDLYQTCAFSADKFKSQMQQDGSW
jgi:hypothetical protein